MYLGCWGGQTGSLWFDDVTVEEIGLLNLVRRQGAPLVIRSDGSDTPLTEGKDFAHLMDERMGVKPWNGGYDIYHEAPAIKTPLPDGARLRVSYYHAATTLEDQAMICPSELKTIEILRDEATRMRAAWHANGYMMSHDEIRVFNWCVACQKRGLDAGALLAENVRTSASILREVNPGGCHFRADASQCRQKTTGKRMKKTMEAKDIAGLPSMGSGGDVLPHSGLHAELLNSVPG